MICKSLNAVVYKTKENPLKITHPHKKIAYDFHNFFKRKVDQINESFVNDTIKLYEYDNQLNGIRLKHIFLLV